MDKKLRQRSIINTEIKLSEVGLGTVKFGRNTDVKYPSSFDIPDNDTLFYLLKQAHKLGIDYLDTAVAYGVANSRLGDLLSKFDFYLKIVTKIGERYSPENGSQFDFSKNSLREDLKTVKNDLNRKYIEVVLLHCGDDDFSNNIREGIRFLSAEKNKGNIGAIGLSCKTFEGIKLAISEKADVIMIEPDLYYANQKWLKKNNSRISIIIKKIFNSGKLLKTDRNLSSSEIISKQLANKDITSVVIGTINHEHLQINIQNI
ncbi:aldo/keto reductase [Gammaproteobacteria bacterium]|nr:aldo/keto reductase [Gammaproteobacteria bacterium]